VSLDGLERLLHLLFGFQSAALRRIEIDWEHSKGRVKQQVFSQPLLHREALSNAAFPPTAFRLGSDRHLTNRLIFKSHRAIEKDTGRQSVSA